MLDYLSSNILFYNAEGTVNGVSTILEHTFTPALISISPSTGSAGGAMLTVTGISFGIDS